jgi:hypothetical protein
MNASMRLGSGFVQPRSGGAHRPLQRLMRERPQGCGRYVRGEAFRAV